ncbi:MAG: permease [Deltaproteobacteria bacterium]|nr:permease [Deltaproteobacteria bacterium]
MPSTWALVALSLGALALAPLLAHALQKRPALAAGLDSFVLVSVGAVVVLHVVPHSAEVIGAGALVAALAGLLLPIALHRVDEALSDERQRAARTARQVVVYTLFTAGLAVHALLDGAALAAHSEALALGVVAHRLPAGLALWVLVRPRVGTTRTVLVLAIYALGTVAGAAVGGALLRSAGAVPMALVQALVAGSIVHVVAESPPLGSTRSLGGRAAGMAGAALAAVALSLVSHEEQTAPGLFDATLTYALATAPWLLTSFVLVGVLSAFYPDGAPRLRARGLRVVDAAAGCAAGLAHPLCACAVGPLFQALVARGASPAAARAFLVAAPALGVPAALLSLRLLAWPLVLARVVAAAVLAVSAGLTSSSEGRSSDRARARDGDAAPLSARLRHGLRHGVVDAVDHVLPWLFVGLMAAGALSTSLSPSSLTSLPPLWHPALAALLAFPLYLCPAGLTPVAAALLALGLSPGGALALVLAGPATSLPSLVMVSAHAGRRAALTLGLTVLFGAAALGMALDALAGAFDLVTVVAPLDPSAAGPLELVALFVLAALGVASLWRQGVRGAVVQVMSPQHRHAGDHEHGPGCAHEHGPPLAPPVPGAAVGSVAPGPLRVRLSFDPRSPPAQKDRS